MGKKRRPKKIVNHSPRKASSPVKRIHELKDSDLSRLATTVKADAQTLILDVQKNLQPRVAQVKARPRKAAKQLRQTLVGFGGKLWKGKERPGAYTRLQIDSHKRVHKLAKRLARVQAEAAMPTRSHMPLLGMVVLVLALAGGYYTYKSWNLGTYLPDTSKLGSLLDHKAWLQKVSGQSPQKSHDTSKYQSRTSKKSSYHKTSHTKRSRTVKNVTRKASVAKKSHTSTKHFNRLSKKQKQKIWQEKLAELKNKTQKNKRKVSRSSRR